MDGFFNLESIRDKKLLIMGGTQISCEIVRYAKRMGVFTVVADYYTPENSPAKRIADEHFQISVTDVNAVAELIKTERLDGVIVGFNDMLLPYYAQICEKTNLPCYGTKEQFEIFINKDRYKKLLQKYNIPTIEEYEINLDNFEQSVSEIKFPVIVKPSNSSGSRGITVCYDADGLRTACRKAQGASATGKMLVERYLTGEEATVFWTFQDGKYYVSGIGNRHVKQNQEGVLPLPVGYTFPANVTERYLREVLPKAERMFASIGIKNGMMFMQCKIEDGECVVYDIGYRLTGSLEYKIFEETCGYNPMEMLIYFALTGKMSEKSLADMANPYLGKYAYNISFLCKPGRIAKITGENEVLQIPGVIDSVVEHYPGEEITENMKGLLAQISLRVLGVAESAEEMKKNSLKVQECIHIISDQGQEMVLPGLIEGDFQSVANI